MHPRERIEYRTQALKAAGLWREMSAAAAPSSAAELVDARSNDYLGLSARKVSRSTSGGEGARIGAGASRLVSGTWPEHLALEAELADWLRVEACLVFSSGYAANVGVVSALAGPGELVLSDSLNHASIIDGCRLSRAEVVVLPHRDLSALERALTDSRGVRWVVTESYFSMDGDSPDLAGMRRLCDAHGAALIVDEAHALGVFGPEGRGLCAEARVVPDVLVGGMGKALGIHGGFVACSRLYRDWLWNRARSLVFSTAPSPQSCELARERVRQVRAADTERAALRALEHDLAAALHDAGIQCPEGRHGPLFPVVLGSERAVLAGSARARELDVLCHPIRPPTVPRGLSRLRVTLRADMSPEDVQRVATALKAAWEERSDPAETEVAPLAASASPLEAPAKLGAPRHVGAPAAASSNPPRTAGGPASLTPPERDSSEKRAHAGRESELSLASEPAAVSRHHAKSATTAPDDSEAARSVEATVRGASNSGPHRAPAGPFDRCWVILGTGTGIGKTFVARSLVRSLTELGQPVAGLKPIETGLGSPGASGAGDAAELGALAFHAALPSPHPLYGFPEPVTPARAARARGQHIELEAISNWVCAAASTTGRSLHRVVETAGGVFSPLSDRYSNFDLARTLDPAIWILVAPNRLGVLHDVTSAVRAMSSLGRAPDWIVLSAPEQPDASTSSNREELGRLHSIPTIELPRHDARPLAELFVRSPTAESA